MDLEPVQQKVKYQGALLRADGSLAQVGWSPQPRLDCNLEQAHFYRAKFLQPMRIKRWDYYGVFTPTHYFSFTISHIGYMGLMFCYVLNFETKQYEEQTIIVPFGKGVQLSRNSTKGECRFENKQLRLQFTANDDLQQRRIVCDWKEFGKKHGVGGLTADISLLQPKSHESMNIVIPIEQNRFYFNRKINCMPASGMVQFNGEVFTLNPQTDSGSLDWGRGVWALQSHWVWASSSGFLPDGRRIGLNLGYGFGDNSRATENAFILDGKIHKLGTVEFEFDSTDYNQPWHMRSTDGRLNLLFEPFFERVAKTDVKLLRSEVHQMFGRYSGTVVTDEGNTVEVNNLIGFAEEHFARW